MTNIDARTGDGSEVSEVSFEELVDVDRGTVQRLNLVAGRKHRASLDGIVSGAGGHIVDTEGRLLSWCRIATTDDERLELIAEPPRDETGFRGEVIVWNDAPNSVVPVTLEVKRRCFDVDSIQLSPDDLTATITLSNCGNVKLDGRLRLKLKDGKVVAELDDVSLGLDGPLEIKVTVDDPLSDPSLEVELEFPGESVSLKVDDVPIRPHDSGPVVGPKQRWSADGLTGLVAPLAAGAAAVAVVAGVLGWWASPDSPEAAPPEIVVVTETVTVTSIVREFGDTVLVASVPAPELLLGEESLTLTWPAEAAGEVGVVEVSVDGVSLRARACAEGQACVVPVGLDATTESRSVAIEWGRAESRQELTFATPEPAEVLSIDSALVAIDLAAGEAEVTMTLEVESGGFVDIQTFDGGDGGSAFLTVDDNCQGLHAAGDQCVVSYRVPLRNGSETAQPGVFGGSVSQWDFAVTGANVVVPMTATALNDPVLDYFGPPLSPSLNGNVEVRVRNTGSSAVVVDELTIEVRDDLTGRWVVVPHAARTLGFELGTDATRDVGVALEISRQLDRGVFDLFDRNNVEGRMRVSVNGGDSREFEYDIFTPE